MTNMFSRLGECSGIGGGSLPVVFDAEVHTPELLDQVVLQAPRIRDVMAGLRESLPLVPHAGVGPIGRFYRLPNHFRSISFVIPDDSLDPDSSQGVVVFKGTEPLLPDFPDYYDWMLGARFRSSALPLGLHFPMDMKLPPAAMWIAECLAEQAVSSRIQLQYLRRHGRLARLPLPLFVFKFTPVQLKRYEECIRSRISADAFGKIRNKLADGLGVEVYYYPELPVRAADLFVGNVREVFKAFLPPKQVACTFDKWTRLLAEMLCLGYMPFAPWHHGMGSCVDAGNVCIDGGFNDLLTLIPFDAIPDDVLFRQSMQASIQMLAESMTAMSAACVGNSSPLDIDATVMAASYVTGRLRDRVIESERNGYCADERLRRYFRNPAAADILDLLHVKARKREVAGQYLGPAVSSGLAVCA